LSPELLSKIHIDVCPCRGQHDERGICDGAHAGSACNLTPGMPFAAAGVTARLGGWAYQRDGDVVWAAGLDRCLPQFEHCLGVLVLAEHLAECAGGQRIG
jgi:hypothetical protein